MLWLDGTRRQLKIYILIWFSLQKLDIDKRNKKKKNNNAYTKFNNKPGMFLKNVCFWQSRVHFSMP